jgi:hypothetical protein
VEVFDRFVLGAHGCGGEDQEGKGAKEKEERVMECGGASVWKV